MNAHQITKVAARAIHAALSNPTQDEPQLVANLVWQIANQFRKAVGVHVQGVFVHSRPTVSCATFPSDEPSSVEIGDLLLLRSNKTRSGKKTAHRALLLQAKKAHTIPADPGHPNQRYLYSDWPSFSYAENMGRLTGGKRHVTGIDLYDAAQYLLILNRDPAMIPPFPSPWHPKPSAFTAHPSRPALTHYDHLLRVLICFIMGYGGKSYEKPPPRWSVGWSRRYSGSRRSHGQANQQIYWAGFGRWARPATLFSGG